MNAIRRTDLENGVVLLTFDRPDSSANIFDRETLNELNAQLDQLAGARGLVINSAKPSIFVAGADLHSITKLTPAELRDFIALGQDAFSKLARLSMPTVAAIHGAALGGGYEVCLACDWRVASPDRSTKIGLPETKLGILPAWGGCTRLPRLIGVPKALDIILGGKAVAAKHALKLGMVDEVAPREYLVRAAMKWLARGKHPHSFVHSAPINALVDAVIAPKVRSNVEKRTHGHYPAIEKAMRVVMHGAAAWNERESLQRERDAITELIGLDVTKNLLRLFFLQERAKKLTIPNACHSERSAGGGGSAADGRRAVEEPRVPPATSEASSQDLISADVASSTRGSSTTRRASTHDVPQPSRGSARNDSVGSAAVIGAGVMGAGIAQWLSARGVRVILRDIDAARVAAGMASISKLYADAVKHRTFTPNEARAGLERISPAPIEVPLRNVDIVIEAAVEKMEIKKAIFRRLDEQVRDDTILATNTSALSITELASATRHPARVIGIHFFNPVHRMQLVELVVGRDTAPEIAQRALRFVQKIGKLPVVVRDSPGFLVNRILLPYMIEAGTLFDAGAGTEVIDEVMLDFGMPMGPLRLIDEVGVDVAEDVAATLASAFPDRMRVPPILHKLIEAGLLGRKAGKGFYVHRKGREPAPNDAATALRTDSKTQFGRQELSQRMVLLMVNEAARCLEEKIVESPADIDFAMVMGTGWAPFRGGPLRYADSVGTSNVAAQLTQLAETVDARFAPCALLREMNGKPFYEE